MSRRGSRGTAGTLRRLGPSSKVYRPQARRSRPQPLCSILTSAGYLTGVGPAPEKAPILDPDPARAWKLPRDAARQVCLGLADLGYAVELVEAM